MAFGGDSEVVSLHGKLWLDDSQFKAGLAAAKSASQEFSSSAASSMGGFTSAVKSAGSALSALGPVAAGAFTLIGGAALKASSDVSNAFNQIRVATGATGPQLAALNASFEKIGGSVPNTLGEVGKALATLSQRTGLTGKSLEALAVQELNLSTITGTDVAENIRLTTRLFGDWGISVDKQAGTLDSLFRASQKTGISVSDLSRQLTYYGAPLRELGIGFDQAAALVGKFENEGVNAKLVLGALRIELSRSAKGGATDLAHGFEQAATAIKNASTQAQAITIATKIFGALRGPDMAAAIREGRLEVDALVKSIAGSHDTINKAAADTMTFSKGFSVLRNDVELALAPLGKGLGNSLATLGENLKPALSGVRVLGEQFAKLPGPVQVGLASFAAATPILGPQLGAAIGLAVGAIDGLAGAWKDDLFGIRTTTEKFTTWVIPAMLEMSSIVVDGVKEKWGELTDFFGGLWQGLTQTLLPAISDFGKDMLEGLLAPLAGLKPALDALLAHIPDSVKGAFSGLQESLSAFDPRNIAGSIELARNAWLADHPGWGKAPAGAGGGAKPRPRGSAGGGDDSSGGNWWDKNKKTAAQKEDESAQKRIAANARILQFLHAGESVDVARLAGEYLHLGKSRLEELVASQKQVDAAVKTAESRKAYMKDLGTLNAEIRRLKAGHDAEAAGVDALKEKYPGLTRAQYEGMNATIQWKKHLQELRAEAHQVAESIRGIQTTILAAGAGNKVEEAAAKLFGPKLLAQGKRPTSAADLLKNYLTPAQQNEAVRAARAGAYTIDQGIQEQRNKLFENYGQLDTGGQGLRSRAGRVYAGYTGPDANQFLSGAQQSELLRKADTFIKISDAATRAAAAQSVYDAEWGKLNQVIGTAGVNLDVLQGQFKVLTGRSTLAREVMEQFGVNLKALPPATQAVLRSFSELQHRMAFFQEFAQGVQSVFQQMFTNLAEHGFKGFFKSVVSGFSQMLQQMAAKYLSSQLANLFVNAIGGAFGGAGEASGAEWSQVFGMAGGGDFKAGKPFVAGERGPELVFPRSSGYVMPHAQSMALAGAGGRGGDIHVHMNVQTQDVQSFRAPHNQQAIFSDLHRQMERARRRGG